MKSSPGLLESASASLKHFLYLDDYRVASYVSQLKNGLTLIKQLRELSSRGIQDNPLSFEKEQRVERKLSGGLGFGVGNVEGERVQTETHRVASGGQAIYTSSLVGLDETRVAHDNMYLELEKELFRRGLISNVDEALRPGLVLCQGTGRFVDLQTVLSLLQEPKILLTLVDEDTKKQIRESERQIKAMVNILRLLKLEPLFLRVRTNGGRIIYAPLNERYLRLTPEQMRGAYTGDFPVNLVGYFPFTSEPTSEGPEPDFQLLDFYKLLPNLLVSLIGPSDGRVEPLAAYTEQ